MSDDPASVVDVTAADVLKAGRLAARLTRGTDGVTFDYLPDYEGPPVATTLPLGERPVPRPGGALPGFFTGLLPEGRRLGALRRAVKTSVDDELSLLLAVGNDTVGDVQIVSAGTAARPAAARVQLDVPTGVRYRDLLAELDLRPDRTALPGVQDKVSAAMINVPAARAGRALILELDPPEYPGLVENEAVLLRACAASGLSAAAAEVVRDVDGAPAVLQRPDGEWRVCPAYDVPTSQPYGDTTYAMPVNGRRTDAGAGDVLALGAAIGLPAAGRRVLRTAVDAVDGWLPLLDELPYDAGRRRKLLRVIRQRQRRLTP